MRISGDHVNYSQMLEPNRSEQTIPKMVEAHLKPLFLKLSEGISKFSKDEQEVYFLGVNDGLESFEEFDSGVSWPENRKNEIYDLGVNIGQAIGQLAAFSTPQDSNR